MKSIKIKGKDYVMVNERIIEFRKLYPTWSIRTRILEKTDKSIMLIAEIFDEEDKIVSDGFSYEHQDWDDLNQFSYVENCQTGAVGRALGNLGIGIETSIASYEEVARVIDRPALKQENAEDKKTKYVIQNWLSETDFQCVKKMILDGKFDDAKEVIKKYSNSPFGMKRAYRDELTNLLESEKGNPDLPF